MRNKRNNKDILLSAAELEFQNRFLRLLLCAVAAASHTRGTRFSSHSGINMRFVLPVWVCLIAGLRRARTACLRLFSR